MKETAEEMDEVCLELLRVNELESAYIRPFVFYGSGARHQPEEQPGPQLHGCLLPRHLPGEDGGEGHHHDGLQLASDLSHQLHTHGQGLRSVLNSVLAKQEALLPDTTRP